MAELLTGGEIVAEFLIRAGVPYVAGIPGYGNLPLVDALRVRQKRISVIQVKQDASGVYLAEGHYRAGQGPLAVFTSIGPGAANVTVGLANAYADSMPVMVFTGSAQTYMAGKGVSQAIERSPRPSFPAALEPVTKGCWQVVGVSQLPQVLHRAYSCMMSGRRGPVVIDLPVDVQADAAEVVVPDVNGRLPQSGSPGDSEAIAKAAQMLAKAQRPVILAGGGALAAEAWHEIRGLAEHLGAAVVVTLMGKGVFPEDHPLYAGRPGPCGTACANKLCAAADVILALGCRFTDVTTSSFKPDASFSIPPTQLVQVDIDPAEIGKNYSVAAGIVGDARAVSRTLLEALRAEGKPVYYEDRRYFHEIQRAKADWEAALRKHCKDAKPPVMISAMLQEVRKALERDAIVVTSSGHLQTQVGQGFPVFEPRTHITAGGFAAPGFGLPAALGAKLAQPQRQVVALVGDGDLLVGLHELSTAVQHHLPIVVVVANNMGWRAAADLQTAAYGKGKSYASEFIDHKAKPYTPDFVAIAKAFGCYASKVTRRADIGKAIKSALAAKKPALVEVRVSRDYPQSGGPATGWRDVPVPTYIKDKRQRYERQRDMEELI